MFLKHRFQMSKPKSDFPCIVNSELCIEPNQNGIVLQDILRRKYIIRPVIVHPYITSLRGPSSTYLYFVCNAYHYIPNWSNSDLSRQCYHAWELSFCSFDETAEFSCSYMWLTLIYLPEYSTASVYNSVLQVCDKSFN